jgi:hypothetical protein
MVKTVQVDLAPVLFVVFLRRNLNKREFVVHSHKSKHFSNVSYIETKKGFCLGGMLFGDRRIIAAFVPKSEPEGKTTIEVYDKEYAQMILQIAKNYEHHILKGREVITVSEFDDPEVSNIRQINILGLYE